MATTSPALVVGSPVRVSIDPLLDEFNTPIANASVALL